jgi:lipoprotein NlpD
MNRNTLTLLAALVAATGAGCASHAPAPVTDRRPAPAAQARPPAAPVAPAAAARPGTYVVKRGDTLYSIALEHGADYRELAQWNKLDDASRIRIGQELRMTPPAERSGALVGAARGTGEIEARPLGTVAPSATAPAGAEAGMKTSPKALRLPYSEQNLAALQRGEAAPEAKPEARAEAKAEPAKPAPFERPADSLDFIWPAKGKVIAGFSEPRSKGVDIEAKAGDPVVAAAAGRVIYVGSGIPGLGKFIVVRHDNGFNTVYAHNRENLVKMDQTLARGQKIAEVGSTDADTPRLHFQIRKFGTPLDPLKYLPPSVSP